MTVICQDGVMLCTQVFGQGGPKVVRVFIWVFMCLSVFGYLSEFRYLSVIQVMSLSYTVFRLVVNSITGGFSLWWIHLSRCYKSLWMYFH